MSHFSVSVSMAGFESVAEVVTADNVKEAKVKAVNLFLDRNDIERDAEHSDEELVNYYGPKVKKVH